MKQALKPAVILFTALLVSMSVASAWAQTPAQQLFAQGKYAEALATQRTLATGIEKQETARAGAPGNATAEALLSLSWYALFTGAYGDALAASERALVITPNLLAAETNRAHALLLMGRTAEARKLYLAHKGKKLNQRTDVTWEETVAEDFDALQAVGIKHVAFAEIVAALGMTKLDREIAAARRQAKQLFAEGKYSEGEVISARYVDLARQRFGESHAEFAAALNSLALNKMRLNRPEAEALFKQSIAISEKALAPKSLEFGQRLSNLGVFYESQGRYPEAESLFKRHLEILEQALPATHVDLASTLYNLGFVNRSWRRYAVSEPFFKRALDIAEKAYGPDNENHQLYVEGLADLYLKWGRMRDANAFYQRLIALDEKILGSENPEFAERLNVIAVRLVEHDYNAEAEPLFKRALAISEKALGAEDAKVGNILRNLGLVYERRNRYRDAEPLYKRSIVIGEKQLGPFNREVGRRIANLAVLYRKQRRIDEAEPLFMRALDIAEKALGPDHMEVSQRLNSLGVLYLDHDRLTEAEPLFNRSIAIAKKKLGFGDPKLELMIENLADSYSGQRRFAEAEQLLKSTVAEVEKALGPNHASVGDSLLALANHYFSRDRQSEAEPIYQRTLAIYEKTLGAGHLKVATALDHLAYLYTDARRDDVAARLAKRALVISEARLGKEDATVATRQLRLASIYTVQKNYADAEALLKEGLATVEKLQGPDHADVAKYLTAMAALYHVQGKYADAEQLHKRSLALMERTYGPNHHDVGGASTNLGLFYYDQSRFADAEPLLKRALAIAEKIASPDDPELAQRLSDLARLYLAQADQTRASDYWKRSTEIMLRRIQRGGDNSIVGARNLAAEFDRAKHQFVGLVRSQSYMNSLIALGSDARPRVLGANLIDPAMEFTFSTVQWAQNSKAAAALAQMATRSAKGDAALAAIMRERQDLVAEWQTVDVVRNTILAQPPEERDDNEEARIGARLAAIDARIAEIDQRLKTEFPNFAALSRLEPLSMKEVQALLGPDEAVVLLLDTPEFGKSPGITFVWVVGKTYYAYAGSKLSTAQLNDYAAALRCGLDASWWDDAEKAETCRTLVKGEPERDAAGNARLDTLPFDTKLANNLYTSLFAFLKDSIKNKHLFIVAPGPLAQLPFHVLVTETPQQTDSLRSVKWLSRTNSITVLPNVSALKALRRVGKPSLASKPMIGIGNPLLDGDRANAWEIKWAQLAREKQVCKGLQPMQQVATRSPRVRPVVTRGGLADLAHLREQMPLPDTADELCTAAAALKAAPGDIWLGANATETEIKRLSSEGRLADYRVVHFATHGTLAGQIEGATEPGLILTPPANASDKDDGYLSASEVASLKLDADWVILSACNTAGAKDADGEALSGLASAFFYAGSRALMVSHWAVASDAAVKLITRTVAATSGDAHIPRAEALRQAMLTMVDQGDFHEAHPAIWAPFVVVGEGGAAAN